MPIYNPAQLCVKQYDWSLSHRGWPKSKPLPNDKKVVLNRIKA